jgi:hypothetical protein
MTYLNPKEMCNMASYHVGVLLLAASLGQAPPSPDYYAAATAASRELSNQFQYLQQAIIAVPRPASPPGSDSLFQQTEDVLSNLQVLRQQLSSSAPREQLVLSFDGLDGKINTVFSEIQGMERWNPGLRMVARRVRYAQSNLHFAISSGDGAPMTQAQRAYRQTLTLQDRTEDCLGVVRYVFAEQDPLPAWNAGFADFRGALDAFQKMQKNKASADALKQQLAKVDASWAKLVNRFNQLPTAPNLLLSSNFAQVDGLLDRLSKLYGVPDRRAPLKDPFS